MVRKPSDINEVKELCRRYNAQAEEVTVTETVNLTPTWYEAVCRAPLDDYIFLSGKGGYRSLRDSYNLLASSTFEAKRACTNSESCSALNERIDTARCKSDFFRT